MELLFIIGHSQYIILLKHEKKTLKGSRHPEDNLTKHWASVLFLKVKTARVLCLTDK